MNGCFWPILLKKSAMVSAAEKHASEIEIFLSAEASGLGFHVAACKKKALSPVNDQVVWADRLFSTESADNRQSGVTPAPSAPQVSS